VAVPQPVTFIFTNSYDGTTDLLVSRLESASIFRFNFDLWREYRLVLGRDGFEIGTPAGRVLRAEHVAKLYWRKPCRTRELFPDRQYSREELYVEEECWYAMREVTNMLWAQRKLILVEPRAEERTGKFVQMRIASEYFEVPSWKFVRGAAEELAGRGPSVVKSLTLDRVQEKSVIFTTRVDPAVLDPAFPWLIQDQVDAPADVTVVFVRGQLFAFELSRAGFVARSPDWRAMALETPQSWKPHALSHDVSASIVQLMSRLSLDYGRLDFLLRSNQYLFLEVNPNGEWGWLDPKGEFGLLERMLEEMSPATPVHPIPVTPNFQLAARA